MKGQTPLECQTRAPTVFVSFLRMSSSPRRNNDPSRGSVDIESAYPKGRNISNNLVLAPKVRSVAASGSQRAETRRWHSRLNREENLDAEYEATGHGHIVDIERVHERRALESW